MPAPIRYGPSSISTATISSAPWATSTPMAVTPDFDPLDNGDPISSSGLIALDPDTQRLFFIGNPDGAPGISIYTVNLVTAPAATRS